MFMLSVICMYRQSALSVVLAFFKSWFLVEFQIWQNLHTGFGRWVALTQKDIRQFILDLLEPDLDLKISNLGLMKDELRSGSGP